MVAIVYFGYENLPWWLWNWCDEVKENKLIL
jgi:hypothetical protein